MKHNSRSILIVGAGSSGMRFARIAKAEGFSVTVFRHRKDIVVPGAYGITDQYIPDDYDAVIIATPPSTHIMYAHQSIAARVPTLVDKPLSDSMTGVTDLLHAASRMKTVLRCGFNLRFLPIIQTIKSWISDERLGSVLFAEFSVGQYLPFWRPGRDYRKTYSSQYALGGGVALDLIHELDIALDIFPNTSLHPIISEKLGNLDISVEDFVSFQSKEKPIVRVSMNYLSHVLKRRYEIIGTNGSVECDIAHRTCEFISKDGEKEEITNESKFDMSRTYVSEFRSFVADIHRGAYNADKRTLGIHALKIALKGRRHVKK